MIAFTKAATGFACSTVSTFSTFSTLEMLSSFALTTGFTSIFSFFCTGVSSTFCTILRGRPLLFFATCSFVFTCVSTFSTLVSTFVSTAFCAFFGGRPLLFFCGASSSFTSFLTTGSANFIFCAIAAILFTRFLTVFALFSVASTCDTTSGFLRGRPRFFFGISTVYSSFFVSATVSTTGFLRGRPLLFFVGSLFIIFSSFVSTDIFSLVSMIN